jgi:hypothetical protein
MNEYTDLKVVECNRLHSEEAKSNNNENFALWTNNLQDIIHLNPGDKVSVQGAMISERGAGQPTSIEIKGESLGIKKSFDTIEITTHTTNSTVAKNRIDQADEQRATYKSITKEIFDNKGYFVMNYFVPANGHNYIDLPRRFWYSETGGTLESDNYYTNDSQSRGMSFADPFGKMDTYSATVDTYDVYDDYYQVSGLTTNSSLSKVKKDNARYTIMIREYTYNSSESAELGMTSEYKIPPRYLRTPEHHTYRIVRELKEIEAPLGFNSPDYLATEITRQLQKVETTNVFNFRDPDDRVTDNPNLPGFPIPITKSISTKTYKPFNVAGYMGSPASGTPTEQEKLMLKFVNASTNLADGWDYLNHFSIIGCKRPELYEYGRLINRKANLQLSLTRGSHITEGTYGDKYKTSIPYTNVNILNDFKNFIQAQEKYPEIWDMFKDSRTDYDDGDTINNSRWVHINRFKNASMTFNPTGSDAEIFDTATLGWGGYKFPPWNNASKTMKSVILPIEYDSSQRDTYYEHPDEEAGERTYGCFGREGNNIVLYGTKNNGSGSALLTMLYNSGAIEAERKIGFDQHFSAPGMTYILPCDMRADPSAIMKADDYTDDTNVNGYATHNLSPYSDIDAVQVAQLYLGANAPQLNWNGANFTISNLHTAMNSGNNLLAGNPTGADDNSYARNDTGESDVVYKINPREDFCDFTPARKPYLGQKKLGSYSNPPNEISTSYFNQNLEAWRVYDCLTGIMIEDFGLAQTEWTSSLWGLLGFSYKQFHSASNTRLSVIDFNNANDLSIITTNAEINEGDTKIYTQNMFGTPLFYNRLPFGGVIEDHQNNDAVRYLPEIVQKTQSIEIIADKLPTRMIRGYYTIRSNILQNTPFIGGKVNNTIMPICGVVNKINNYGDFVFGEESSLVFTITKPLKLASITCSIHDPDGSYARCSEQSTILFKVQKDMRVSFNVIQDILQEEEQQKKKK